MSFRAGFAWLGMAWGLIGGGGKVMIALAATAAGAEDKLLPVFGEVSDDLSVFADGEFGFFGFSLLLALYSGSFTVC